jgi:hypothetical protein
MVTAYHAFGMQTEIGWIGCVHRKTSIQVAAKEEISNAKVRHSLYRLNIAALVLVMAALVLVMIIFLPFLNLDIIPACLLSQQSPSPFNKNILGTPSELREARESLLQAKSHRIASHRNPPTKNDQEKYTYRINMWHRHEKADCIYRVPPSDMSQHCSDPNHMVRWHPLAPLIFSQYAGGLEI